VAVIKKNRFDENIFLLFKRERKSFSTRKDNWRRISTTKI